MPHGLILLAHGARDPQWRKPFETLRQRIAERQPDLVIELAFLEFMEPDLVTAGESLAQAGCMHVSLLPVFLGVGGHVRRDVPAALLRLAESHPQIHWRQLPSIGESDAFLAALADATVELLGSRAS